MYASVLKRGLNKRSVSRTQWTVAAVVCVAVCFLLFRLISTKTAAELVGAERVWELQPFRVEEHHARDTFVRMVSTHLGSGFEPRIGTEFASVVSSGFRDTPAWNERKRLGYVPVGSSFAGAPAPNRGFALGPERLIREVYLDESWWEQDNLMPLLQLGTAPKLRTPFQREIDKAGGEGVREDLPTTWPNRGTLLRRQVRGAQNVPFRDAIAWGFARNEVPKGPSGIGGFLAGPGSYEAPHEYVIEDRTTGVVRRVAFSLSSEGDSNMSMMLDFSSDGNWAVAFDRSTREIWFIPLHLAWNYIDSTPPPDASQ